MAVEMIRPETGLVWGRAIPFDITRLHGCSMVSFVWRLLLGVAPFSKTSLVFLDIAYQQLSPRLGLYYKLILIDMIAYARL